MKIRLGKIEDIEQIDIVYQEGVIDEVKLQFPNKPIKEIIKDLNKNEKERLLGIKNEINSKLNFWIVVENNKEIIAFGQAEINKENKENGMIQKVYVLKGYRKKGIASKIMKRLIDWLRKQKIKYVSAGIFIKNIPSINMNKKFGFKVIAVRMQKILK